MRHRFTAPLFAVLVLALAAFTGSAFAGDGHGSGGGDSGKAAAKDHSNQSQPTKHEDKQSSTSAEQPATGGDNSKGVKPSNSTKHDTYAKASSDQTKQYGNGKTAGQIATQAGYGDATLHGPGNSQPHKTAPCPGGHEVDVHALKNKKDRCASSEHSSQKSETRHESKSETEQQTKSDVQTVSKTETKDESKAVSVVSVTFCDMASPTTGKRETKSAIRLISHELNGTPEEARDIVPPFTFNGQSYSQLWDANGQAIFNAGCNAPAQAQVQATQATQATQTCGTTTQTVTEQVLVGVKHMIGPKGSGRFVVIHPNVHSAHFTGKHEDDVPLYESVTKTITVPVTNCPAATSQSTQSESSVTVTSSSVAAPAATTTQAAGAVAPATASVSAPAAAPATAAAAPAPAGGVKGAVVALKPTKTKPAAGGVLGATTRLGGSIASTRLPFTGLPLWIFASVALALIAIGLTVRRSTANRL